MDMVGARRLVRMAAVLLLSMMLAACGAGGGDDEAEETPGASDAQPTLEMTEEAVESPSITDLTDESGTSTPAAGEEESVSTPAATPTSDAADATAVPAEPDAQAAATPDDPQVDATPGADDPAGVATPQPGTDAGDEGTEQGVEVAGDGTTGADVDLLATPALAGATPAATPAVQADSATPDTAPVEPLAVTSCDIPNVPPYQGEVTTYQLTVDVNFRVGPGTDCDLALETPIGEFQQVEVIGGPVIREDDGTEWVQIAVLGTEGWVAFEFLAPVE